MSTIQPLTPTHRPLADLHFDQQEWLNKLRFYKEEIGIFEARLEEIVTRNTHNEVLAQVEHFQNRYIREREVVDVLRHDIKEHENFLEKEVRERPVAIEHRLFKDHAGLRDRMDTFERLHHELKDEFRRWLARWM